MYIVKLGYYLGFYTRIKWFNYQMVHILTILTRKLCDFSIYVIKIFPSNLLKKHFLHEYLIYLAKGYWKWGQIHLKHFKRLKSGKKIPFFAKQFFRPRVTKRQFLLFFNFTRHADNFYWPTDFVDLNKIKHLHYRHFRQYITCHMLDRGKILKITKNYPKMAILGT